MDQGLEELAPKCLRQKSVKAQLFELGPRLHFAVQVVEHEAQQYQPERCA